MTTTEEWLVPPLVPLHPDHGNSNTTTGRSCDEIREILSRAGMPLEMATRTPEGSQRIVRYYKNAPTSMLAILARARTFGDATFILDVSRGSGGAIRLSFADFHAKVRRLAHALQRPPFNVTRGERVAILMSNRHEWILTFWAAIAAGAIVVPLNSWLKPVELDHCLSDSGTCVVVGDWARIRGLRATVRALREAMILRHVVLCAGHPADVDLRGLGYLAFDAIMESATPQDELPPLTVTPDDDATIFYTSGTTGKPKGALGTHINFMSYVYNSAMTQHIDALRRGQGISKTPPKPPPRAALLAVPLFHVIGCHAIMSGAMLGGIKLTVMGRWDASLAIRLIERERITTFIAVPALVWQMLEHPDLVRHDVSSLTTISYGGAPASPDLLRTIRHRLPLLNIQPGNGYGLTETSGLLSRNFGVDYFERPNSVGQPAYVVDVRITKPGTFEDLPPGPDTVGEICIRGPGNVKGYWRNESATAKSFSPTGWFLTGDIGRLDDSNFLYILDRHKDMLIRGGENIHCVEVEDCIFTHDAVMDCAVVGLPHRTLGEEVAAVVQVKPAYVARDGSLRVRARDIIEHCRGRLAAFKCPVLVDIRVEPLPRNAAGKVLKPVLREDVRGLAESGERRVAKGAKL